MGYIVTFLYFFFSIASANSSNFEALGLCQGPDGTLMPLEQLVCESSPALLEALNPTLEIPICNTDQARPKVLSGDSPVSAVFVSCTSHTLDSCKNIASSVIKNQPGVTVNILVTSEGIAKDEIYGTLLELTALSKNHGSPINILPINSVSDQHQITYMRDPGLFINQSGPDSSFVNIPYNHANIPGTLIMNEAMNWCGIEHTDTYRHLASFDSAYNSLIYKPDHPQSEHEQRYLAGLSEIADYSNKNATMGGNFIALPNGTLFTGYTDWYHTNPTVIDYFSKEQKVIEVKLPELNVGHIDEVVNIVPSPGPCGYAILQASPHEAITFLKTIKDNDKKFLKFFDLNLADPNMPEKKTYQDELRSILASEREAKANGSEVPAEIEEKKQFLIKRIEVLSGAHTRKPAEILNDPKIIQHWEKLEEGSNRVLDELLSEISSEKNSCIPEVVKLPVFWDQTMASPLIPNPVNGLAINGSYFKSTSIGLIPDRYETTNRISYPHLDDYINNKLESLFPMGIHSVDTSYYDKGSGNFHCATTNIYLPCKTTKRFQTNL